MHVLHLTGATTTRFYAELSETYARNCVRPARTRHSTLSVAPDGALRWTGADGATMPVDLGGAARRAAECDVAVPHMFCPSGMTTWRALLEEVVGLPVVGPDAAAIRLGTSKWATKALARAEGVDTPAAARLHGPAPCPDLPAIVKPDDEDNSIGLSLVRAPAEWDAALARALEASGTALAEAYVPGREVRAGVLDDGALRLLPVLEYHVTPERPIRLREDKVHVSEAGQVTTRSWDRPSLPTSCPADLPSETLAALERSAFAMHRALGCRDYSLYDFRVDPDGRPWLLEACIFWTFTPFSIVSRMLAAEGTELERAALSVWSRAAARRPARPLAAQ